MAELDKLFGGISQQARLMKGRRKWLLVWAGFCLAPISAYGNRGEYKQEQI